MSGQVRKPKGFSYKTWAFRSRVVLHKTLSNNPCRNWLSSEAGGEAMMNSSQVGRGGVLACFGVRRARMGTLVLASVVALSGCGVSYTSPTVKEDDAIAPVNVVELTAASAETANRSNYTPRSIPAEFYSIAYGSNSIRGTGALPEAPRVPNGAADRLVLDPPPQIETEPYLIGIGDVVLIATRGSASTIEQLSGLLAAQSKRQGYTVRDDGAIAIPEVGIVQIAGMTLEQAEDALFKKLVENQFDPSFSLEVSEFNSQRIAVGGAVDQPVLVPITLNTPNLGEALTAAGGVTVKDKEFGTIRIYRDGRLYQIPLKNYFADTDYQKRNLKAGDAIYVDTSYDLDRAFEFYKSKIDVISLRSQARSNALATLEAEVSLQRESLEERRRNFEARLEFDAEARDFVYLTGEVVEQSRIPLPFNRHATLADVLFGEGGFETATGDPAEIYVIRANQPKGEITEITAYHLNAQNAANIVIATRLEMRPNDIVFVEEQPITKWGRALQQLFPALITAATP